MVNGKDFSILFLDIELDGELLIPHDLVQFEWNFDIPNKLAEANCSLTCCDTNRCCDDEGPSTSTTAVENDSDLATGCVMMCTDCSHRFCIITSSWYIAHKNTCPGGYVGKIYKGMSLVKHLASLELGSQNRPLQNCRVVKVGFIEPGESLSIQPIDAVLDNYPTSPSNAVGVDFSDIDAVIFIAYGIKTSASLLFRQGKYHMAMSRFKKAVQYLTYVAEKHTINRDQEIRLLTTIIPCILDSAMCKIKLKDFDGAVEDCNEALEISPLSAKCYFRRGQAHHGKMNYEQSLQDLCTALKLAPNEKCIRNEIATVEGEIQVYKKVERRRSSSDLMNTPTRETSALTLDDDDMPDLFIE